MTAVGTLISLSTVLARRGLDPSDGMIRTFTICKQLHDDGSLDSWRSWGGRRVWSRAGPEPGPSWYRANHGTLSLRGVFAIMNFAWRASKGWNPRPERFSGPRHNFSEHLNADAQGSRSIRNQTAWAESYKRVEEEGRNPSMWTILTQPAVGRRITVRFNYTLLTLDLLKLGSNQCAFSELFLACLFFSPSLISKLRATN